MEIQVNAAELKLVTTKLTKKILNQLPTVDWQIASRIIKDEPSNVIGWIHQSALDGNYRQLLLKTGEGSYALFPCTNETASKFKQIFIM